MQHDVSRTFRQYASLKISAYLEGMNIRARLQFSEGPDWIVARFLWKDKTLSLHVSMHHVDHRDGISVYLKTKFGEKNLRNEVQSALHEELPAYSYSPPQMNAQFDRIVKDMKLHFEKYLLV